MYFFNHPEEDVATASSTNKTLLLKAFIDATSIAGKSWAERELKGHICRIIYMETLHTLLAKENKFNSSPKLTGKAVIIANKTTKQSNYFTTENFQDAFRLVRAITMANAWLAYKNECDLKKIQPNERILMWLPYCVNQEISIMDVTDKDLSFTDDNEFFCYIQFVKKTTTITGLKITSPLDQDLFRNHAMHLLTNIRYDQLLTLNLEGTLITDQILNDFHSVICYNGYMTHLSLGKNLLTDFSLDTVIKIFEITPDLKTIDLSYNQIACRVEAQFSRFLNRINELLETFTLKMAHNPVTDAAIVPIEKYILYAQNIDFVSVDISYSSISKHGLWRLFMGYLNNYERLKKFSLNLFPLPFHPQILQNAREVFTLMNKLYIPKLESQKEEEARFQKNSAQQEKEKLLSNLKQINDSKDQGKSQLVAVSANNNNISKQGGVDNSIQASPIINPANNSKNQQSPQNQPQPQSGQIAVNLDDENDEQKLRTICFQRVSYTKGSKPPPNKRKYILKVHEIEQEIDQVLEKQSTIEEIKQLCQKIAQQEFEFPLRLLEGLHEYIWNRLNEAILIRDHYATSFLTESATLVGLDIGFFQEKIQTVQQRQQVLMSRIENLLNFDLLKETDVNGELDDVVKECLRLDMRGLPVDMLLMIKEKRDNFVKSYIEQDFDPDKETLDSAQQDCFSYLNSGKDKLKVPKEVFNINSVINNNLFTHATRCDYLSLSKIQQQTLLEYVRILEEQIRKNQPNQYYYLLARDRAQYLAADHFNNFASQIWNKCVEDIQINCSRLIVQYNHFFERDIGQVLKQPLIGPQQIQLIQQYYQTPSDPYTFQQEHLFEKYAKLKAKIRDNPDLLVHKEGETFVKPLVFESMPGINNYFVEVCQMLLKMFKEQQQQPVIKDASAQSSSSQQQQPPSTTSAIAVNNSLFETQSQELIEKLIQVGNQINNTAYVQTLYDEIYLQIHKFLNRKSEVFLQNNISAFKLLSLLSMYTPPSSDMIQYVKAWIYISVSNPRLEMMSKKIITNLLNQQELHFTGPKWIPSLFEIQWRFTSMQQFQIVVRTTSENDQLTLRINEFDQVKDVVNMLMENEQIRQKGLKDLGTFWLYIPGSAISQTASDIALPYEQCMLEVISLYFKKSVQSQQQQAAAGGAGQSANFYFLFKRRLFCAHYTVNTEKLSSEQLENLYDDIIRMYLDTDLYLSSMNPETVQKIASLIYNVQMKQKNPQAAIMNPDNVLRDFKPQRSLYPVLYKTANASSDSEKLLEITKTFQLLSLNLDQLRYNIIVILKHYPFFASNMFKASFKENKQLQPSQIYIGVNAFGILLFQMQSYRQPFRIIMYEEIIYMFTNGNEGLLCYYQKDSLSINTLNITFDDSVRSQEWHLDILSYSVLRLMDSQYSLYSYNELWKLMYRFNNMKLSRQYKIYRDIKQGVINIIQYNQNDDGDINNDDIQSNLNQELINKKNILIKEMRNTQLVNTSGKEFPFSNPYKLFGKQRVVSKQLQYYADKSNMQGNVNIKDNLVQRGSFGLQKDQQQLDNINRQFIGQNQALVNNNNNKNNINDNNNNNLPSININNNNNQQQTVQQNQTNNNTVNLQHQPNEFINQKGQQQFQQQQQLGTYNPQQQYSLQQNQSNTILGDNLNMNNQPFSNQNQNQPFNNQNQNQTFNNQNQNQTFNNQNQNQAFNNNQNPNQSYNNQNSNQNFNNQNQNQNQTFNNQNLNQAFNNPNQNQPFNQNQNQQFNQNQPQQFNQNQNQPFNVNNLQQQSQNQQQQQGANQQNNQYLKMSQDLGQELNKQLQNIQSTQQQQQNNTSQQQTGNLIKKNPQQQDKNVISTSKFQPPIKGKSNISSPSANKNPLEDKKDNSQNGSDINVQGNQDDNQQDKNSQDNNSRSSSKGRAKKESKIDGIRPRRSSQSPKPSEDGDQASQTGLSDLIQDKALPLTQSQASLRQSGAPVFSKKKAVRDSKYIKK